MRKLIVLLILVVLVCSSSTVSNSIFANERSAAEFVSDMRLGWNLGNALDSTDYKKQGIKSALNNTTAETMYETMWGNPVTTREMIETVAEAGFGAVRIPVTYYDHMDDNFNISQSWLDRVEEIVNYVLDSGMYCIINLHHDAGKGTWLKADPDRAEEMQNNLAYVWKQIAERFSDYDERLVFESFNEILDIDQHWENANPGAYEAVNKLNQTFVDTIRSSGGNNTNRFLLLATYAAGTKADIITAFSIPNDTENDKLIISVHTYIPYPFSHLRSDNSENQQDTKVNTFYTVLDRLKSAFIDNGIPVVITEFGAQNKNNVSDREEYAKEFVTTAKQYGITCFWWDDGGSSKPPEKVTNFALLDRAANTWFFPSIVEALVDASNSTAVVDDAKAPASTWQNNVIDQPAFNGSGPYVAAVLVFLIVLSITVSAVRLKIHR